MKRTLVALILLTIAPMFTHAQLPKKWTPDYTISISHTGSMSGASTHVKYFYDRCEYEYHPGSRAPIKFTFKLTEEMREQILARMRELKVDEIKSSPNLAAVNDGWSESIQLGTMYIAGGTSATMSDADKGRFSSAHTFLQEFAMEHEPKK